MNIYEQMHSGALYLPNDETLVKEQLLSLDRLYEFNRTRPTELEKRSGCLRRCLPKLGRAVI